MWNRCPLRANLVHWRRCRRPARSGVLTFLHKTPREFCKMCDANVELECRCVSLFAEGATSTLAEMFSIEISQAPWNFLDRDAYCEFRAPYHKRALQLCPGSSQKRARILISTCTSGILWRFTDFVFVRFLRQRGHALYRGRRVVSTIPDEVIHLYIHPGFSTLQRPQICLWEWTFTTEFETTVQHDKLRACELIYNLACQDTKWHTGIWNGTPHPEMRRCFAQWNANAHHCTPMHVNTRHCMFFVILFCRPLEFTGV